MTWPQFEIKLLLLWFLIYPWSQTQNETRPLLESGYYLQKFIEHRFFFTYSSFKEAAQFALDGSFDGFLAVGGGSVMDTAKAANLYSCFPENDFLDFVNAPIGKGMPVTRNLKPLVCG